jgi:lipooligosaccharide transport system permease protein
MTARIFAAPVLSLRFVHVWRRNLLVWRKLAIPSMLGNLADPMIMLFGLGYGLGAMVPAVNGVSYVSFLAGGMVASSTMYAATFEAMYSAFSRMHQQKTWEGILNAPILLEDVVMGELVWATTKATLSGISILLVVTVLGVASPSLALWVLPVIVLTGFSFAALGLVINALAPGYDFFMYYFTLVITPTTLLCGVFFPIDQLPAILQNVAALLPLYHAVALARPLMLGTPPTDVLVHLAVPVGYAAAGFYIALVLTRRRLLN